MYFGFFYALLVTVAVIAAIEAIALVGLIAVQLTVWALAKAWAHLLRKTLTKEVI